MGRKFGKDVAKRYGEVSEMLVFLGKRGRKTVQKVKSTAVAKYYGFERRTLFSTEGSFGKGRLAIFRVVFSPIFVLFQPLLRLYLLKLRVVFPLTGPGGSPGPVRGKTTRNPKKSKRFPREPKVQLQGYGYSLFCSHSSRCLEVPFVQMALQTEKKYFRINYAIHSRYRYRQNYFGINFS